MWNRAILIISASFVLTAIAATIYACSIPPGGEWEITFEVVADPIDLVAMTSDLDFGGIWAGQNAFSNQPGGHPRCTVENRGYAVVDFTVSATCSTGWTLGGSVGDFGPDRVVLAGVFTAPVIESESAFPNGRDLALINFGSNDVLSYVPVVASQTVFAIDPGSGGPNGDDPDTVKGFHVVPYASQVRSFRFMVQAPTSDTKGIEQMVTIIIGAIVE